MDPVAGHDALLLLDDAIGAEGNATAGQNADRFALQNASVERVAGSRLADDLERGNAPSLQVGGAYGVAVHRRAVVEGKIDGRCQRVGEYTAARISKGDRFALQH